VPYYHRYNIRTSKVPSGHIYIPLLGLLGNDLKVDKFIINSPASPQYWDIYAYRVAQLGTFIGRLFLVTLYRSKRICVTIMLIKYFLVDFLSSQDVKEIINIIYKQ